MSDNCLKMTPKQLKRQKISEFQLFLQISRAFKVLVRRNFEFVQRRTIPFTSRLLKRGVLIFMWEVAKNVEVKKSYFSPLNFSYNF